MSNTVHGDTELDMIEQLTLLLLSRPPGKDGEGKAKVMEHSEKFFSDQASQL